MSEKYPLVSVITPTYNRADYLVETIESVLAQDYPNFEYIILDDGSTDDTTAVLAPYQGRDGLIIERHDNRGEVPTVNKAYRMARGEYLTIVNSDDPILPGFLSAMVAFMEARPELLAAYPDWDMIDADSKLIMQRQTYEYDYLHMLRRHYCIPGSGAMIRRKALEVAGLRNESLRYSADFDYWLQLGLHGPMARLPKTLATFRVHPGSATVALKGQRMVDEHIELIDNVYRHDDLPADILAARAEAYAAAYFIAASVWLGSDSPEHARSCYLRALRNYPAALWRWPRHQSQELLRGLLPGPVFSALVGLMRVYDWLGFQTRRVRHKLRLIQQERGL